MRRFSLWVLLISVVLAASAVFFIVSSVLPYKDSVTVSRSFYDQAGDHIGMRTRARKLEKKNDGDVGVEDYHPIDPSPATKASVRPGPIQHGTPLNPYVPRPPSPSDPNNGG